MRSKFAIFLVALFTSLSALHGQSILPLSESQRKGSYYFRYETSPIEAATFYRISLPQTMTSIAIQGEGTFSLSSSAYVIAGNDTLKVTAGEDVADSLRGKLSDLLIFSEASQEVVLYSGELAGTLLIHGFDDRKGRPVISQGVHYRLDEEGCELPNYVSQSVWRRGLPAPQYQRAFHTVRNMIVHHSAGSNASTDFTAVVRNIYLFHTESNGWSDIGYNYLIDPTGTLFLGRDPGGGEQDQVRGAHFCGQNSGTMGVCLLGNFEEVDPSEAALEKLVSLLSWKAFDSSLDPLGRTTHPLNSRLPVIAGHRQGCATNCPGVNLFGQLSAIRENVALQLTECQGEPPAITFAEDLLYPNPNSSGRFFIEYNRMSEVRSVYVLDALGKRVPFRLFSYDDVSGVLEVDKPAAGYYIINLVRGDGVHRKKVIVK